jgi:phenylalanyl-tRNA synthetase beta chain
MIVSLNWLREYVDISLSVEDLVDRLTMAGLEVDAVRRQNLFLDNVITVRVEKVTSHPGADRLRLCAVSDGSRNYQVVCGAPNVEEGAIAPLALAGAKLASGITLKESRIRGELSQGMLCSQKELGAGEDESGIWLLPRDTPVGMAVDKALGLEDVILDIGVTPNRSDCLCILGVAREVAAICGSPLRYPDASVEESGPPIESLSSVTIDDPVGCPRYAARVIQGVTIGPSPGWLVRKLEAVGLRSINNIVDVTNFVLMELGQPLHAFDFDRLHENRIVVRRAVGGERFTTLDGVERTLFDDTLLICDGREPVAIAGIMGGLESEISSGTQKVLLESAYFQPQCIRRSSKKLGLRSEASYRFERGIDPEGVVRALDRAAQLMVQVGGGEIAGGRIDVYPTRYEAPRLTLRVGRTNRFLGTSLQTSEMAEVLRSIEMQVREADADRLQVVPPSFRPDITREVDLAEEVVRLVGYDRVPVTSPRADASAAMLDPHLRSRLEVKGFLQGAGFFEIITYSFVSIDSLRKLRLPAEDPRLDPVRVLNPLSEEQGVMRTSLLPGLLNTARYNMDRRNEDIRIFELSKVFLPGEGDALPNEPHHLAGLLAGRRAPQVLYGGEEEVNYTDVKGVVESIIDHFFTGGGVRFNTENLPPYLDRRQAASVHLNGEWLGAFGRLHPEVLEAFDLKRPAYLFELDFDKLFSLMGARPSFRSLPKFPAVSRDMALIVDAGLLAQEPLDFIRNLQEPLLEHLEIFDIYQNPQLGEGKKSVGYRLVYRAPDRSLTDEDVNELHNRLVSKVIEAFGATLR